MSSNNVKEDIQMALLELIDEMCASLHTLQETSFALTPIGSLDVNEKRKQWGALISHGATKLSLFTNENSKEVIPLCKELAKAIVYLVASVCGLPNELGKTVLAEIKNQISALIVDVGSLANSLLSTPLDLKEKFRHSGYLLSTGIIWKACDMLKSLALDNKTVCMNEMKSAIELVEDAMQEVDDLLNDQVEDEGWDDLLDQETSTDLSDKEKQTIQQYAAFIKSCKLVLVKTMKMVESDTLPQNTSQIEIMDKLVEKSKLIQEQVDEVVILFESPLPTRQVTRACSVLSHYTVEMIGLSKMYPPADTNAWFDRMEAHIYKTMESLIQDKE